jgi:hypothetical protein
MTYVVSCHTSVIIESLNVLHQVLFFISLKERVPYGIKRPKLDDEW